MRRWERLKADPDRYEKHKKVQAKKDHAHTLRAYGLNPDDFDLMLTDQLGCCAVCNDQLTGKTRGDRRRPSVDHHHGTGKVRALLCVGCNLMIGYALERPEVLEAGSKYLKSFA
jgi:hypothetical protein